MKNPNSHVLYIDKEIWEKVKPILAEIGLSRSQFAELLFKYVIETKTKSLFETQESLFSEMVQMSRLVAPKKPGKKRKKKE